MESLHIAMRLTSNMKRNACNFWENHRTLTHTQRFNVLESCWSVKVHTNSGTSHHLTNKISTPSCLVQMSQTNGFASGWHIIQHHIRTESDESGHKTKATNHLLHSFTWSIFIHIYAILTHLNFPVDLCIWWKQQTWSQGTFCNRMTSRSSQTAAAWDGEHTLFTACFAIRCPFNPEHGLRWTYVAVNPSSIQIPDCLSMYYANVIWKHMSPKQAVDIPTFSLKYIRVMSSVLLFFLRPSVLIRFYDVKWCQMILEFVTHNQQPSAFGSCWGSRASNPPPIDGGLQPWPSFSLYCV